MRKSRLRWQAEEGRDFVLWELSKMDVDAQVRHFLAQHDLPAARHHFELHGAEMNCADLGEYLAHFEVALGRGYEEMYVLRQSVRRPVLMWRATDKVSGEVLQFSQATGKLYSIYRAKNWRKFVHDSLAIQVYLKDDRWVVDYVRSLDDDADD